jgi:hypothetical protein
MFEYKFDFEYPKPNLNFRFLCSNLFFKNKTDTLDVKTACQSRRTHRAETIVSISASGPVNPEGSKSRVSPIKPDAQLHAPASTLKNSNRIGTDVSTEHQNQIEIASHRAAQRLPPKHRIQSYAPPSKFRPLQ